MWTLKDGFQSAEVEFIQAEGKRLARAPDKVTDHPADLYAYADTNLLIDTMAGSKSGSSEQSCWPGVGRVQGRYIRRQCLRAS